jgi:tetratricopeptide (TPR) repeat protein
VATSQAPEASEMRALIAAWLKEGRAQAKIRSALVADYGSSILEKPSASGLGFLLWALPVAVIAIAGGGLSLAFARWRRAEAEAVTRTSLSPVTRPPVTRPPVTRPPVTRQGQPRRASVRSGVALSRRLLSGKRYERAAFLAGLVLVALAAALWLLDRSSSPGAPARTAAASEPQSAGTVATELQAANSLAGTEPVTALALYGEVLASEPGEPAALVGEAVIYARARMATKALALLREAERSDPAYAPAHLDRGLVLLSYAHEPRAAVAELRWYMAYGPKGQGRAEAAKALAAATAAEKAS